MRLYAVALLAVAALACSKSKPAQTTPPPPLDDKPADATPPADPDGDAAPPPPAAMPSEAEMTAMFDETLTFLEELATAVDATKADCAKMAKSIDAVLDGHTALLAKAKQFSGNHDVDAKANEYMDGHKDRVGAATQKLTPGMTACGSDPAVQASMARFDNM